MYWLLLCWALFEYGYRLSWEQIVLSCSMILYQTLEFFQWLLIFALWSLNLWLTEHNSNYSILYYYNNTLLKLGIFVVSYYACLDYIHLYVFYCLGFRNVSRRWFFLFKWYNLKSFKNTSLNYQSSIREQYQEDKGKLEGKTCDI